MALPPNILDGPGVWDGSGSFGEEGIGLDGVGRGADRVWEGAVRDDGGLTPLFLTPRPPPPPPPKRASRLAPASRL